MNTENELLTHDANRIAEAFARPLLEQQAKLSEMATDILQTVVAKALQRRWSRESIIEELTPAFTVYEIDAAIDRANAIHHIGGR